MRGSPQCHGFFLQTLGSTGPGIRKGREVNPVDLCPFTLPCYHRECDPSALIKFGFYRAYATGLFVDMRLDIDEDNNLGKYLL
jgi:hypothetical protein